MAVFCNLMISHSVIAMAVAMRSGCPVTHPSPRNESCARMATTASLPSDSTVIFDSACQDIENRIRGTTLRKNLLMCSIFEDGPAQTCLCEKGFGIE
jgi:hypothetical protein